MITTFQKLESRPSWVSKLAVEKAEANPIHTTEFPMALEGQ